MEKTRKEIAMELFKEGYNCSQAVFAAFADVCGMERDTALRLASFFGGGFGRMREVCGTVSGMALTAGMLTGNTDPKDVDAKKHNYDVMQQLAAEFRRENGSIVCKELLGQAVPKAEGNLSAAAFQNTTPEPRTEQYYKKRPCVKLVGCAAEILERNLLSGKKY